MIGTKLGHDACDHEIKVTECGDSRSHAGRLMEEEGGWGEEKVLQEGGVKHTNKI